jgi:hypothetical protein
VLKALPSAPYRPDLIGTYDDGDWVAIVLEDIAVRHPEPADEEAVRAVVTAQAAELTPPPVAVLTLADRAPPRRVCRRCRRSAPPRRSGCGRSCAPGSPSCRD